MGCFSWLCPCLSNQDLQAQKEAKEGLQEILKGYRQIAKLDLPAGAASLIADIRRCVTELEKVLGDVKMPKARQWVLPLPQEQAEWSLCYPKGGFLLRRQMCMASFGDGEWAVGCLFISDFGIAFDSGHIFGELLSFETGFLPFQDITSLTTVAPSGKAKGTVNASIARKKFSKLQLQLSIQSDVEWLLEFWKRRCSAAVPSVSVSASSLDAEEAWNVPDNDEGVKVPPPTVAAKLMHFAEDAAAAPVPPIEHQPEVRTQRTKSILSLKSLAISRRWSEDLSSGFAGSASALEPHDKPTDRMTYDQLTEEAVIKGLESEKCLARFVEEEMKGWEISDLQWQKSKRVEGTLVRKFTFQMKLPADVPKVVRRLIAVPDSSSVTMLFRLRTGDCSATGGSVVLTYQTCTHDVTFGENFRVQETLAFSPLPAGGIEMKRWAEVVWVAPLPWTMGAIKTYIEEKAKNDGKAGVQSLVRLAGELGS